jgi:hypothetical protein
MRVIVRAGLTITILSAVFAACARTDIDTAQQRVSAQKIANPIRWAILNNV